MSYSFQLKNGDLQTNGSVLALVHGKDKLLQDVDLWLKEIYRVDRFHPTYGSVIESFIGNIISVRSRHEIEAEIHRVLTNLQNLQLRRLKSNPMKYTPDELLHSVLSVTTHVNFDMIVATVIFQSVAGAVQSARVQVSA